MKGKVIAAALACACAVMGGMQPVMAAQAETQNVIYEGVSVGPVEVGGMTKEDAKKAMETYIEQVMNTKLTLSLEGVREEEKQVTVTARELGVIWANPEVLDDAVSLGDAGNIIKRYKAKKDIENSEITLDIAFSVDQDTCKKMLESKADILSVEAKNATIAREGETFIYTDEVDGKAVDVAKAVDMLTAYLAGEWQHEEAAISLAATTTKAEITRELCESIEKDPMATYTTSFSTSGSSRCSNIENAVRLMTGTVLLPGEDFSCLEYMVPFTAENGYYLAGSYLNGKNVDSYGGGVCQVSTTLYNTVLLAELEVVQRNNHGLTVGYVPLSADAAIAESSGMDFIFKNNTNAPIYIEGIVKNKTLTFNIYGKDERPANRTIKYVSSVLEEILPGEDVVTYDETMAMGAQVVTQKSHTGYRAALYKYVYIDGVQESKEKINSSYYAPAPNYITKGPEDPNAVIQETNPDGTPVETITALDENGNPIVPADAPAEPAESTPAEQETTAVETAEGETTVSPAETTPTETIAAPAETTPVPVETTTPEVIAVG